MSSKVFSLFASVLLIQSVYGQCLSNYYQTASPVVEVVTSAPAYSLGGCGASLLGSSYALPNSGLVYGVGNNAAYGLANSAYGLGLQQSPDVLSVASGSAAAPGGISLLGENLAMGGEVSVVGSTPFLGTVGVSGAVPTTGQALVSYSSAQGLGLTSGGCGQGVSAAAPAAVLYENVGLAGVNNLGLAGFNNLGLAGVNNLGLAGVNNLGLAGVNNLGLAGVNNLGLAGVNNLGLAGVNNLGLAGVNNLGLAGVNNLGLAGVNNFGLFGNGLGLSSCGCGY